MAARRQASVRGLTGSQRARTAVAAILEAFSGEIGVSEAAELLGVSLSRYYQLESRALAAMLQAMEPRKRGLQKTPAREIQALRAQKRALEQELRRHQSLLRAANRSLGLVSGRGKKASSKVKKRGVRGKTVLLTLREEGDGHGPSERDGGIGGDDLSGGGGARAHEGDPADLERELERS
jgi:hypothetical protein